MNERELNLRVADEICNGTHSNLKQFRVGSRVALLDGKVVAVADQARHGLRAGIPHDGCDSMRASRRWRRVRQSGFLSKRLPRAPRSR